MGGSSHTAAGSALGYLYQCMWALVELAERGLNGADVRLRLEALDDIEFEMDGAPETILQTKHHLKRAANLSDMSVDIWRTLNVWIDAQDELTNENLPILRMVTTATAASDCGVRFLRSGPERDINAAGVALELAARTSKSSTTATWRQRFLQLSDASRSRLLEAIVLDDGAPPASDINQRLRRALGYALPQGHDHTFMHYLIGWWCGIAIALLDGSRTSISAEELSTKIQDLVDQFRPDNLPTSPEALAPFVEGDAAPYQMRVFVAQLNWIALDATRLWKAIRDYHRAYTQRSEWLRLHLVAESELDQFANSLFDEWEQVFDTVAAHTDSDQAPDRTSAGMTVFERVMDQTSATIRGRYSERWLNRGTLHGLADDKAAGLGWHLDFAEKMAALSESGGR